jgi:hypothetical protein
VEGNPIGGTALTIEFAKRLDKPCLVVDVNNPGELASVREWCRNNNVRVLNVAEPRASEAPQIYARTKALLGLIFPSGAKAQV